MANRYWVLGTGTWDFSDTSHWSAASGGASGASVPAVTDNVFFDASSGGGTVTVGNFIGVQCLSIDTTGFSGTISLDANTTLPIYGSCNLATVTTITNANNAFPGTLAFYSSLSGNTVTTNSSSRSIPVRLSFGDNSDPSTATGVWTLQDDLVTTEGVFMGNGTLTVGSHNVTCRHFWAYGGSPVLNMGSGQWLITYASSASPYPGWYTPASGNVTINAQTCTLKFNISSEGGICGGGHTLPPTTMLSGIQFLGNVTFSTLTLTAGKTYTSSTGLYSLTGVTNFANITLTSLVATGTAVSGIILQGSGATATRGLNFISSATQSVEYCTILRSAASGATFYACHSTDLGGNSGWTFGCAPPPPVEQNPQGVKTIATGQADPVFQNTRTEPFNPSGSVIPHTPSGGLAGNSPGSHQTMPAITPQAKIGWMV